MAKVTTKAQILSKVNSVAVWSDLMAQARESFFREQATGNPDNAHVVDFFHGRWLRASKWVQEAEAAIRVLLRV